MFILKMAIKTAEWENNCLHRSPHNLWTKLQFRSDLLIPRFWKKQICQQISVLWLWQNWITGMP